MPFFLQPEVEEVKQAERSGVAAQRLLAVTCDASARLTGDLRSGSECSHVKSIGLHRSTVCTKSTHTHIYIHTLHIHFMYFDATVFLT